MKRTGSWRWVGVLVVLIGLLMACERRPESAPTAPPAARSASPDYQGTIVAVGDSLTAGLGVNESEAYPARLERKLAATGYQWRVINAGISGETSSGALSRVAWVLRLQPDLVILETGANDGLRGVDPRLTRRNIDELVRILKDNRVTVILAGMRMVANLGPEYTRDFAAIYPAVAEKHDLALIPFFLEGVAGQASLNQADGLHPTAEGYRIIAEMVYPYVAEAIAGR